jgi:hypothetical protein
MGCIAVGMKRALESATGLPSRSTSASPILVLRTPAEVRRNLMMALLVGSVIRSLGPDGRADFIGRRCNSIPDARAAPPQLDVVERNDRQTCFHECG